jgi:hypothetical protein
MLSKDVYDLKTCRRNRDPAEKLLHDGFQIRKIRTIIELGESFLPDNVVELCLCLLLHIRV